MTPVFMPADVILPAGSAGGEGAISGGILNRETRPHEAPAEFAHVGACGLGGDIATATIIEQLHPHMREVPLASYAGKRMKVYRLKKLTYEQRVAIAAGLRARAKRKEPYGTLRILAFMADSFLGDLASLITGRPVEVRLFTRIRVLGRWVCSEVIGQAFAPYGVQFINGSRLERIVNGFIGLVLKPLALLSGLMKRIHAWWHRRRKEQAITGGWGVTPDDIADYCAGHPEEWELIADFEL